jgi:hypothetical protein
MREYPALTLFYYLAILVIATSAPLRGADSERRNSTLFLLVSKIRADGGNVCFIQRRIEEHNLVSALPATMDLESIVPIIVKDFDYTFVRWSGYPILIPKEMEQESVASPVSLKLTDLRIDGALASFGKAFGVRIGVLYMVPPLVDVRTTTKIEGKSLWQSLATLMRASNVDSWNADVGGPYPSLPGKPSYSTRRIIAMSLSSK